MPVVIDSSVLLARCMDDEEGPAADARMQRVADFAARGTAGTRELQLPPLPAHHPRKLSPSPKANS